MPEISPHLPSMEVIAVAIITMAVAGIMIKSIAKGLACGSTGVTGLWGEAAPQSY